MSILRFIRIPVFNVSLAIGLLFVYIFNPDKRKIFVYPSPENVNNIQYKDSTGACFEFKQTKLKCPEKESEISKVPAQTA
jgi:hypothetical protein